MPKINIDSDLFEHPKIRRLRTYCGDHAEIYLIRLWCYAAKFHPKDGSFRGYERSEIEGLVGWTGPAGNLISALVRLSLFDETDDKMLQVHDWKIHAGFVWNYKTAGREGGKKSGQSRRLNRIKNEAPLEAKRQNASTIELNGIELNKDKDVSLELQLQSSQAEPIVMVFPTVGSKSRYDMPESFKHTLKSAFPFLDILGECAKALAWIESNPTRRKTDRGMKRFLYSWMERAANRPTAHQPAKATPKREVIL